MASDQGPPAILLMGPTASGKTDLAVRIVASLPCEIISVDSAMVYRGMDVGTAKPDSEVLAAAPHRLIDILDPAEAYSAARFREDACREMSQIRAGHGIPLLVGGTMLYFRALQRGLSALPAASPVVRDRLTAEASEQGWESLHRRLQRLDPAAARRIHRNDPQRIQRALEVCELTGRTLTELQTGGVGGLPGRVIKIALIPEDRSALHEAIGRRFHTMLERGFIEEVQALRGRADLAPEMPSMRAVGYRQIWEYLEGNLSHAEMVERAVIATRQLAKRQMTWLRAEPEVETFATGDAKTADRVLKHLGKLLGRPG